MRTLILLGFLQDDYFSWILYLFRVLYCSCTACNFIHLTVRLISFESSKGHTYLEMQFANGMGHRNEWMTCVEVEFMSYDKL